MADLSQILFVIILVCSILSLLACTFIILSSIFVKDLRTFANKLIVWLSVAQWWSSCSYLIGMAPGNAACWTMAAISQYFDVAGFFWIAIIAFNTREMLVKQNRRTLHWAKYYHIVGWGCPLVFFIVAAAGDHLGRSGQWCWIKPTSQVERFALFYIPLSLIIIYVTLNFGHVAYYVSRSYAPSPQAAGTGTKHRAHPTRAPTGGDKATEIRLVSYLLIFIFVRAWSIANRFQQLVDGSENAIPFLVVMHTIFSPLQGFANSIVYGLNPLIVGLFRKMCGCKPSTDSRREFSSQANLNEPGEEAGATAVDEVGIGAQNGERVEEENTL